MRVCPKNGVTCAHRFVTSMPPGWSARRPPAHGGVSTRCRAHDWRGPALVWLARNPNAADTFRFFSALEGLAIELMILGHSKIQFAKARSLPRFLTA